MMEEYDFTRLSQLSLDDVNSFLTLDIPSSLPQELTEKIFGFLSARDLCHAAHCSRIWRERSNADSLWHPLCRSASWERYGYAANDLSNEIPYAPSFTNVSKTTPTFHSDHILERFDNLSPTCKWKQVYMRALHLELNWRKGRYRVMPVMHGHSERVTCMDCDGRRIASGSLDRTVRVWDLLSGACLHKFDGHNDAVSSLKLADNVVVAGCSDGLIHVYDMQTGSKIMTLSGQQGSIDCILVRGDKIISAGSDRSVRVWSLGTGVCLQIMRGHTDDVEAMECSNHLVVTASWDSTLRVWDIGRLGECLHVLRGHSEVVFCCQFDENLIVSGGGDSLIKMWDVHSGECLRTLKGHSGDVYCLRFNSDVIASGSVDSTVRLWAHDGTELKVMREHIGVVRCMHLLGNRLVTGGDRKKIVVWDAQNGDLLNVVHRNPSLLHIMWMNDTRLITASPESPGTITVLSYW